MKLSWRSIQQTMMWSLVIIIIPMVVFPARFGTDMTAMTIADFLFEIVYYGTVLYFINRRSTLIRIIKNAGICFVYRTLIGGCFGVLVSLLYSMEFSISMMLGVSGYLPAIVVQAAAAPFIMRLMLDMSAHGRRRVESGASAAVDSSVNTIASSTKQPISERTQQKTSPVKIDEETESYNMQKPETSRTANNGFERAVRYIAEHGSVHLAAAVDCEGLLLAGFSRGSTAVAEDWAPFALLFHENNKALTSRVAWNEPEKIDILMSDQRLIIAKTNNLYLMVVAERAGDDVLNIRFNQALEMVGKYVEERYSEKLFVKAEKQYV